MTPTKLPACVFRGDTSDEDAEFGCLCSEREKKTATLPECTECPLRMANHFDREVAAPYQSSGIFESAKNVIVGGYQTAKVYAGIDAPPQEVVQQRYDLCNACEHNIAGQCGLCSCYIGTKIRLASQFCPDHRWEAFSA